jgi:nucleoside-diphosphate-sugar epimerase
MISIIEKDMKQIVEQAKDDLERLDGLKILLAGATGFVGSWLLGTFMASNKYLGTKIEVTALHRGNATRIDLSGLSDEYIKWVVFPNLEYEKHDVMIDAILYNAREPYWTLSGSSQIISSLIRYASNSAVSRVMYISSGAVEVARPNYTPMQAAYAFGKVTGEFMYSRLGGDSYSLVIPRLYSFMGPGIDKRYAISSFAEQAMKGEDIEVDNPLAIRSYMYPVDMVCYLLAILTGGKDRLPYSVGSNVESSMINTAIGLGKQFGVSAQHTGSIQVVNDRYLPVVHQQDFELGLEQTVSFDEGVSRWKEYLITSSTS